MIIFSVQSLGLHKDREVLLEKQLKIVAGACVTYARSHLGRYPPNLAALLETGLIKPAYLSDPTNVREPLVLPSDWRTIKPAILIHAINANSDFRYVGQDLRLPHRRAADHEEHPRHRRRRRCGSRIYEARLRGEADKRGGGPDRRGPDRRNNDRE